MALELKYASDATLLLNDLVEALGKPGSPASVRIPVLMPSRPLVERCKTAMARRYGVWMGVEFFLPAAFIERMARLVGLERVHPSWQPEGLAWRIVPRLAAMVEQGRTPSLASACRDTRSRLALAREVADRFDQYMHFRPQMIAAWDHGETWDALPESAHEDEAWQRALWNEIRDDLSGHPHPAQRLKDLAERIEAGAGDLPATLEVLATGPLAPAILPAAQSPGHKDLRPPPCLAALDRIPGRHPRRSHADARGP